MNVGFNLLFKRNYNPAESSKTMEMEFLASVKDTLVVNPTDSTFHPEENQPLPGDKLEQIALSVAAPCKTSGKSEKNLERLNLGLACLMLAKPK